MLPEISRRCLTCGAAMRAGARFCAQCGKALGAEGEKKPVDADEAAPFEAAVRVTGEASAESVKGSDGREPGGPAEALRPTRDAAPPARETITPTRETLAPTRESAALTQATAAPQTVAAEEPLASTAPEPDGARAPADGPGEGARRRAAARVKQTVLPRVERMRDEALVVLEETPDDSGLRFVLAAAALFVLFLVFLLLSTTVLR